MILFQTKQQMPNYWATITFSFGLSNNSSTLNNPAKPCSLAAMITSIHWPNTQFKLSVADASQFPDSPLAQIAVAGHSNVGKSSMLNTLFARKGLVKTSKNPGCTRLLNVFEVDEKLLVVDLPGYGYAKASKAEQHKWAHLIESYLQSPKVAQLVLVLLDFRHGPKDSDLQMIDWLNESGIRWQPVATKADKLQGNAKRKRVVEMTQILGIQPILTSSLKNIGMEELRAIIIKETLTTNA